MNDGQRVSLSAWMQLCLIGKAPYLVYARGLLVRPSCGDDLKN